MSNMYRRYGWLAGMMCIVILGAVLLMSRSAPEVGFPADVLLNLHSGFDSEFPGRGLADYPSPDVVDVPKAYAMVLMGEIERARHLGLTSVPTPGLAAGYWLLDHADENNDEVYGWG